MIERAVYELVTIALAILVIFFIMSFINFIGNIWRGCDVKYSLIESYLTFIGFFKKENMAL